MLKILANTDKTLHVKTNQVIVDQVSYFSCKKEIKIGAHTEVYYLIIGNSSEIDLHITTAGEGAELHIYGLFFADKGKSSTAKIQLDITHSHTQANIHLLSFAQDNRTIDTDGSITIAQNIQKVQAHLLEENIVLGEKISIKAKPILNISSHDVQASHGAKVEKIDSEKLLYMTSRGLTPQQAQALVVQGYINHIADQLIAGNAEQDEKEIRLILDEVQVKIFG